MTPVVIRITSNNPHRIVEIDISIDIAWEFGLLIWALENELQLKFSTSAPQEISYLF